ncbi:hypothetical protein [Aquiflexum lacus]|uniref:hypothetical protein n=1 Tax=Aquiflexum lacus TaxID=2483805 RepID=UPI001894F2EA|nr:hypothetical protein [Aquiflexum lacus]
MADFISKTVLLTLFLSISIPLFSQEGCKCCTNNQRAFYFWAGTWEVFDTTGNKVGENEITTIENNCALMEKWKGLGGGSGTSMNYYNQQDSTWNQIWVSGNGGILKLKGTFTNNEMVLKSEPFLVDSTLCYNQIKWSQVNNTVKQVWEVYDEEGNVKHRVFTGIYVRKK